MVENTNVETPKFVGWWRNIDAAIRECPSCKREYVAGDGRDDYGYNFCPYCGKLLIVVRGE